MPHTSQILPAIGILGGTFDPVHNGHLALARVLMQQLPLQEIRFIPCKEPVYKAKNLANDSARVAMLQQAIDSEPRFCIDTLELERTSPSYSVLTLQTLRQTYPEASLCFIIGADSFQQLHTWYQWQDLLKYAHLIVVNRPSYPVLEVAERDPFLANHLTNDIMQLFSHSCGIVAHFEMQPLPISSQQIRSLVKQKQPITGLVPEAVAQYIHTHQLYLK